MELCESGDCKACFSVSLIIINDGSFHSGGLNLTIVGVFRAFRFILFADTTETANNANHINKNFFIFLMVFGVHIASP